MGKECPWPVWELTGLALAHTNLMVPMVARTDPAWDPQSGLAIWGAFIVINNEVQCF